MVVTKVVKREKRTRRIAEEDLSLFSTKVVVCQHFYLKRHFDLDLRHPKKLII